MSGKYFTSFDGAKIYYHKTTKDEKKCLIFLHGKDFYKLDNFSKDVAALIKKEEITNPVIVGHCFGGMIST